ncbi:diaminopimelate epimerase [Synergistales bacterium]|nr:diaminopimelate epimerase [Synergistales bacterium]
MELNFIKLNPTQNMTVLIKNENANIGRESYPDIARRIMAYDSVYAEQVGFIEKPVGGAFGRIHMAGGEFCGNATMSLAAFKVWENKQIENKSVVVPLESSGSENIVKCEVKLTENPNAFFCALQAPCPQKIEEIELPVNDSMKKFQAVFLPGITHIIVPVKTVEQMRGGSHGFAERSAKEWERYIKEDAFGIILYDNEASYITPLVRVKPTIDALGNSSGGSLVWERGCGSGSAALGAYLSSLSDEKSITVHVSQPGGVIDVRTVRDGGKLTSLTISGIVNIAAQGVAYI